MRSIFEYLDYRDLLRDAYEERKAVNPAYSYRLFAEALGLYASNVFRVLQNLNAGVNVVMYKASKAASYDMVLDNFTLTPRAITTGLSEVPAPPLRDHALGPHHVYALDGKLLGTVTLNGERSPSQELARRFQRSGIYLVRSVAAPDALVHRVVVEIP